MPTLRTSSSTCCQYFFYTMYPLQFLMYFACVWEKNLGETQIFFKDFYRFSCSFNIVYFFLLRLLNTYKKIHRFMHVIEYFSMRQWDFQIDNVRNLWHRLSDKDKDIFFFDMTQLDWDLFLQQYFRGIRQYLLHDPLDTIPQALVRWNRYVLLF